MRRLVWLTLVTFLVWTADNKRVTVEDVLPLIPLELVDRGVHLTGLSLHSLRSLAPPVNDVRARAAYALRMAPLEWVWSNDEPYSDKFCMLVGCVCECVVMFASAQCATRAVSTRSSRWRRTRLRCRSTYSTAWAIPPLDPKC